MPLNNISVVYRFINEKLLLKETEKLYILEVVFALKLCFCRYYNLIYVVKCITVSPNIME